MAWRKYWSTTAGIALMACALPEAVHAQDAADARTTRSFSAADFERFAPRAALDMVRQIPGFSIKGGSDGDGFFGGGDADRGLGQATQNILLNGQRVSGKANDAAATLSRIDAADVIRIEVVDGATLDIPGLTGEVANIVYRASAIGGTFSWEPFFRKRIGHSILVGEAAIGGRSGKTEWNASIKSDRSFRGNFGPEWVLLPDGERFLLRDEFSRFKINRPSLAASLSHEADNGNIFNANLSAGLSFLKTRQEGEIFDPVDPIGEELSLSDRRGWEGELGLDYDLALGVGRLKLIGLQRFDKNPSERTFIDIDGYTSEFNQTTLAKESVVRSEYRWGSEVDWQVSVEGAYNMLDSEAALFVTPEGGVRSEIPLPGANALVTEKRAEAILSYGRPIADGLTLQLNLGGEYSRLSVDGEAGTSARSYWRPKGSALLAWRVSPSMSVNAEIERKVDQLSFGDILATVDLAENTNRATNIALVPSQRWRGALSLTKSFDGWGTISPYAEINFIEDIVETIPISPTEEALGNVPSARTFTLGGQATLELAALGWNGARLELEGEWVDSSIDDPLLLVARPISSLRDYRFEIALRHDIPATNWAWGGEIGASRRNANYRLNQVSFRYDDGLEGQIFIENKDVAGLTVRATIDNLFNRRDAEWRDVYVDRRDGPLAFREESLKPFGRILELLVKGSF
ncbi:TonB-dependent receptor plug domain-containing protein [Sphingomicrobium clamense]|uniref:TonB-dependent receptor plug domain-containing protein n=1 Tax=Sphingomicrobium clamense TaxID=2851013 RepID=A0ABS6V2U7_9SPHN|nr:TonB-dependent receptor plug domain-containing protein [Sphingomicrobium sp. B8]MBW0143882.1 TonB-dependent receptor plug domain-containing protein [Sphingomicrobium sp. B8]